MKNFKKKGGGGLTECEKIHETTLSGEMHAKLESTKGEEGENTVNENT